MKKTYFKPQFKVVKLHGRNPLLVHSLTTTKVTSAKTNLAEEDDFDYAGESNGDVFAR